MKPIFTNQSIVILIIKLREARKNWDFQIIDDKIGIQLLIELFIAQSAKNFGGCATRTHKFEWFCQDLGGFP